jgi:hypothetical protein
VIPSPYTRWYRLSAILVTYLAPYVKVAHLIDIPTRDQRLKNYPTLASPIPYSTLCYRSPRGSDSARSLAPSSDTT